MNETKKGYMEIKKWKFWGLLVLAFFVGAIFMSGGSSETTTEPQKTASVAATKETAETLETEEAKILKYALASKVISDTVTKAFIARGELLERFASWNSDDVIAFAASGIVLEQAYSSAKELKPPQILTSAHDKSLKGFKLFADSVDITNKGIDTLNPELLEEATAMIKEGTVWIGEASEELEAINKE